MKVLFPTALTALALLAPITIPAAQVTLIFDDSQNPTPHESIHFVCNWNPVVGQPLPNWGGYVRAPMYDDGTNGDKVAGDKIWTIETLARPQEDYLFVWACDDDTDSDNGWLGITGAFAVHDEEPQTIRHSSVPPPPDDPNFAPITLIYDDTANEERLEAVYYSCNWNRNTGWLQPDWNSYERFPMFDDGTNGDDKAGDGIWTLKTRLRPIPGHVYSWACDNDDNRDNGWIGGCDPFVVATTDPRTITRLALPIGHDLTPGQFEARYGIDLSRSAPPRRLPNSNLVLFTLYAPAADEVVLAADFNMWASLHGGVYRDATAQMRNNGYGVWFILKAIESRQIEYQYILRTPMRGHEIIADPLSERPRGGQNSIAQIADLSRTDDPPEQAPALLLRPYDATESQEVVSRAGRSMIYVRARNNLRCQDFEAQLLQQPETVAFFRGLPLFVIDSADPSLSSLLRQMNIIRVPSFAVVSNQSIEWEVFPITPATTDEEVTEFLRTHSYPGM